MKHVNTKVQVSDAAVGVRQLPMSNSHNATPSHDAEREWSGLAEGIAGMQQMSVAATLAGFAASDTATVAHE
jgi:hypothetical protein